MIFTCNEKEEKSCVKNCDWSEEVSSYKLIFHQPTTTVQVWYRNSKYFLKSLLIILRVIKHDSSTNETFIVVDNIIIFCEERPVIGEHHNQGIRRSKFPDSDWMKGLNSNSNTLESSLRKCHQQMREIVWSTITPWMRVVIKTSPQQRTFANT